MWFGPLQAGIYLMAKRILGWDDTHSYETSAK